MGAQFKDTCYHDTQSATDAYYLGQPLTIQAATDSNTLFFFSKNTSGQWSICRQSVLSDTPSGCSLLVPPSFTSCDEPNDATTNFQNGLELGWAVASVVVVGFVWRFLRVRF